jgi:hypothetical protein
MKTALLILVWTGLLAAAGGPALHLWLELEDVRLGFHGWLALGLGVGLSLLLGVGLMILVFHSARRGYDDAARTDTKEAGEEGDQRRGDDAQR